MPERELKKKPAPQRREDEVVEEPAATDSGEKIDQRHGTCGTTTSPA